MKPLVSVCLPNLNTRPYLQERIDSIRAQSYGNWELVVSDNYSDDGAWEFFQEVARSDSRVSIAQAPREGMYANWNRCIERARGEFVYIATSDDVMPPECLEKLVAALEDHPDCDIAHCGLQKVDGFGQPTENLWAQTSVFAVSSGPLLHCVHVRRAPFDGLLHLLGGSVYISITQLLIRRSLFERIGLFESTWGSVGDFNWNMRAALVANTVHVPDTWGGWRMHGSQATAAAGLRSAEHRCRVEEMIAHAITSCEALLAPPIRLPLTSRWCVHAKALRAFNFELTRCPNVFARRSLIVRRAFEGVVPARQRVKARMLGRTFPDVVRAWLGEVGVSPVLVPDRSGSGIHGGDPGSGSASHQRPGHVSFSLP